MNFLQRGCHCLSQTFHLPCLIRLNGCKSNREESVKEGGEQIAEDAHTTRFCMSVRENLKLWCGALVASK